jgi:hypothetical protein
MAKIRISEDLELPAEDFSESKIGIIGKSGRGKSGAVKIIMEEFVRVGLPFVAFDPIGIMWGLRSSLDGKGPGLVVLVIGGPHADVRLDPRAGAMTAKSIVQANVSCIIDFSEESKTAYREFVKDFSLELIKINDTSRMVIFEEAPELLPQRLRPDQFASFDAAERLVSRGRNKGIGVILVSQRAATISKDVLTQVDALLVFGVTSPQDRKALKEWVEAKADTERLDEFEVGIAGLKRQEAWFWSPEAFEGIFKQIRIRNFSTFHPDKTHLRRKGLLEQKPVTTDVSGIVSKLGAQLERFKTEKDELASIPKLQARIRQLEKEREKDQETVKNTIYRQPNAWMLQKDVKAKIDEARQPLLEQNKDLKAKLDLILKDAKNQNMIVCKLKKVLAELTTLERPNMGTYVPKYTSTDAPKCKGSYPLTRSGPAARPVSPKSSQTPKVVTLQPTVTENEEIPLKKGAVRMLRELASRSPLTLTRAQLGTLAGFTPSGGTFSDYFSRLKRSGYLEEDHQGNVRVTEAGLEFVGEVPPSPSSHEEIMDMWKRNLKAGVGRMLDEVVRCYPEPITREDLGERSGFTVSGGTFSDYLSMLKRNGLVEINGNEVKATEVLFP